MTFSESGKSKCCCSACSIVLAMGDQRNEEPITICKHVTQHKPMPSKGNYPESSTYLHSREDVAISGVSCRLPKSENMAEFRDNLMKGVDMTTEDEMRWKEGNTNLPRRSANLKYLSKFDAEFFGVSPKQADFMDPQIRLLLEVSYEAIVDAGIKPERIKGTNTGVFVGACISESHFLLSENPATTSAYALTGCAMTMFANRLSFFYNFKGPSFTLDSGCSSGLLALNRALQSIRAGECDAAIVAGANICLITAIAAQFNAMGVISPDGKCKSFDAKADGYCRSEGVVAIYLQRSDDAKRVYYHVIHSGTNNDGNKEQGIAHPSGELQRTLYERVYEEADIDPSAVSYIEAHGTGTWTGDCVEANAICDFFCRNMEGPLLIGSVKSNVGHTEAAAGLVGVAKLIVAAEEGVIPRNLHFNIPNPNIPGLINGQLRVVDSNTEWKGGYVGISSFGFGGSNVHVILKTLDTDHGKICHNPDRRLLCYSSRTEEGVKLALKQALLHPTDDCFYALLCETANQPLTTHPYRGYTLLNATTDVTEVVLHETSIPKRPIWYVFAGMGSQWPGMGHGMMALEVFRKSILKCEVAVQPYGVKLSQMLMEDDKSMYDDVVNSFVAIVAIQVALVDLLKCIGITPDGFIGHSVGELGCAYADGCLTAEETVLLAYWRGYCMKTGGLPPGSMAVIGMTWQELCEQCPSGVVPACHNSVDAVTISGSTQAVEKFVNAAREQNIFAKEVNSCGIAFHSYFIKKVQTSLEEKFRKVIQYPRVRSVRWISSSVKQNKRDTDLAKYSSADYHVNNILSPVLFHEALQHVPHNAIVIEIAPHSLLQSILRRSLSECCIMGMMKRNRTDNVEYCLSRLGNLFLQGISLNLLPVWSSISYPVCRGTPMLSPLVTWQHSQNWHVPSTDDFGKQHVSTIGKTCCFEIDITEGSEGHYLCGHNIDGRILFPATGYLMMAWESLAQYIGTQIHDMPVSFRNVAFHRATVVTKADRLVFNVALMPNSGKFEVIEGGFTVVSGCIQSMNNVSETQQTSSKKEGNQLDEMKLCQDDVYKELRFRGMEYSGLFKGILQADLEGIRGRLQWSGNFVVFLDLMLQMGYLQRTDHDLRLPTRIKSISIDPKAHLSRILQNEVDMEYDRSCDSYISGGIEIAGVMLSHVSRRRDDHHPILQTYKLCPYDQVMHIPGGPFQVDYIKRCSDLSHKIISNQKKDPTTDTSYSTVTADAVMKAGVEDEITPADDSGDSAAEYKDDKLALIKCLYAVSNDEGRIKRCSLDSASFFDKYHIYLTQAINSDEVFSLTNKPEHLKPCLDIVVANQTANIKVLELAAPNMKESIQPLLASYYGIKFQYEVAETGLEQGSLRMPHVSETGSTEEITAPHKKMNLIIADNVFHLQNDVKAAINNVADCLDDGGFLLVRETTKHFHVRLLVEGLHDVAVMKDQNIRTEGMFCSADRWRDLFMEAGLLAVHEIHDTCLYSIFLVRKANKLQIEEQTVIDVSNLDCKWVDDVKTCIAEKRLTPKGGNIWLYSDNKASGIIGMLNCLRRELGGERIRCVLNNDTKTGHTMKDVVGRLLTRDLAMNVMNADVVGWYTCVPFIQEMETGMSSSYSFVDVQKPGDLSSLSWFQSPFTQDIEDTKNQICHIEFASLNFRDVMLATGKLSPDAIPGDCAGDGVLLGMEFSGCDSNGCRIMGLVPSKALATDVKVRQELLWPIPRDWTLAEAATVPVAYATAYYALVVRGRLCRGERVLIHSGSGGVGQAAIRIALSYGCDVFTTVGTKQKRQYLLTMFPELKDEHIFKSRDTSFEKGVMRATGGHGVELVLNSLSGDKLLASINVVAQHGRFLEIGKYDLFKDTELGMSMFLRNISFHGILLDSLFGEGNKEWQLVSRCLTEGLEAGVVKPLETTVFGRYDVEAAFRYMAQGKHTGKVLIKITDETSREKPTISAIPRFSCNPNKSYIVVGGLGGYGLELAHWLVKRGAREIILTSRSGVRNGYQARKIRKLQKLGAEVDVCLLNVGKMNEAEEIILKCRKPCGGIFNTAMVLKDGLFENQTVEWFQNVLEPKLMAAINLDKITRSLCKVTCDWFVMFSSVISRCGDAGVSNYGFANSGMERICEQRRRDGLHGLAIQWGGLGDVGFVYERNLEVCGTRPQSIESCFAVLDTFLNQTAPVVSCYVPTERKSDQTDVNTLDLLNAICHVIGVNDPTHVSNTSTLQSLGLDSLMNVEIMHIIERSTGVRMKQDEIRLLTLQHIQALDKQSLPDTEAAVKPSQSELAAVEVVLVAREIFVPLNKSNSQLEPLYIIHMMEGAADCLSHMTGLINGPVFGVQWTQDVPSSSISEVADYYLQALLEHSGSRPFHLAGYSYGAMIALEIGYQIEQSELNNRLMSLTLLDGSHTSVQARIRYVTDKFDATHELTSQTVSLATVGINVIGGELMEFLHELHERPTYEERLNMVISRINVINPAVSKQEFSDIVDSYNQRLQTCLSYKFPGIYRGSIALILPCTDVWGVPKDLLGEDFDLKQIVKGNVKIHKVTGNHVTFLQRISGKQVADVINDELSS